MGTVRVCFSTSPHNFRCAYARTGRVHADGVRVRHVLTKRTPRGVRKGSGCER